MFRGMLVATEIWYSFDSINFRLALAFVLSYLGIMERLACAISVGTSGSHGSTVVRVSILALGHTSLRKQEHRVDRVNEFGVHTIPHAVHTTAFSLSDSFAVLCMVCERPGSRYNAMWTILEVLFVSLLCSSCRSWDRSHHVPRLPPSPTFLLPLSTPSIFPIDPSDLPIGIPRRSPNGLFPWKVAQCPHQTFPIPPIKGSQSTRSTSPSPPRSASRRRWRRAQRVAAACFPLLLRTGPPDIVLECKDAP